MKGRTYNASSALVRPELVEIKNTIRNLKKDAEMRLTLDVEAQQSFEFLSEQVHGSQAFRRCQTLVEEVDRFARKQPKAAKRYSRRSRPSPKG